MYKQAIVIFGMVIPGGLLLVSLVVMWSMLGKFEVKRELKIAALQKAKQSANLEKSLEKKLIPRRGQMGYWEDHLGRDTTQSFNESLDLILSRYDGNQLSMAAAKRPSGKGALGTRVEASSSLFQLTFEGGFGPLQELVAEVEARMPHVVLERLDISPGKTKGRGKGRNLKFELTYMAWAK